MPLTPGQTGNFACRIIDCLEHFFFHENHGCHNKVGSAMLASSIHKAKPYIHWK